LDGRPEIREEVVPGRRPLMWGATLLLFFFCRLWKMLLFFFCRLWKRNAERLSSWSVRSKPPHAA